MSVSDIWREPLKLNVNEFVSNRLGCEQLLQTAINDCLTTFLSIMTLAHPRNKIFVTGNMF
jgi:hypothetical protein